MRCQSLCTAMLSTEQMFKGFSCCLAIGQQGLLSFEHHRQGPAEKFDSLVWYFVQILLWYDLLGIVERMNWAPSHELVQLRKLMKICTTIANGQFYWKSWISFQSTVYWIIIQNFGKQTPIKWWLWDGCLRLGHIMAHMEFVQQWFLSPVKFIFNLERLARLIHKRTLQGLSLAFAGAGSGCLGSAGAPADICRVCSG